MQIDVEVFTQELLDVIFQVEEALEPKRFSMALTNRLREQFRSQFEEGFAEQVGWAELSDMRVRERDGSKAPILQWTGDLFNEVMAYKGEIRVSDQWFEYEFPNDREASGKYWGLTAGQLVNPLGLTPLAKTPRPLLGDQQMQERDSIIALVSYFRAQGWEVEVT